VVEALEKKVFFGAGFGLGRFGGVGSGVALHEAKGSILHNTKL